MPRTLGSITNFYTDEELDVAMGSLQDKEYLYVSNVLWLTSDMKHPSVFLAITRFRESAQRLGIEVCFYLDNGTLTCERFVRQNPTL